MLTLEELKTRLANEFDEVSLLELLEIDALMIVNHFGDLIEDRYDELIELFEVEETSEEVEYDE